MQIKNTVTLCLTLSLIVEALSIVFFWVCFFMDEVTLMGTLGYTQANGLYFLGLAILFLIYMKK